ncbi:filamin-binding LIM protein 1 isoform X2 [Hemicordylus capensis]|nr:filamin-binding LIM protein 1 isoform X2 [Hemicordylus capensis]
MLSGQVETRIASSLFIRLAPPRRDHVAKGEMGPPKPPRLPCNGLPQEALEPSGPTPPQTSADAAKGSRGHAPRAAGAPHGGYLALQPRPVQSNSPAPPPYPTSFSVETLGPDLEKRASLQTSSTSPAGRREPNALPLTQQAGEQPPPPGRKVAHAVSTDICAFCHKGLCPRGPAVEAMNKQYHADCFTCRTCSGALVGQHYYQKEGRPLCVACFKNTLEKCARCQTLILSQIVRAMGHGYHPECFTCVACGRAIGDETFAVDEEEEVHCLRDFYRKYASVCGACEKPIIPSEGRDAYKIECLGRDFHEDCYRCEEPDFSPLPVIHFWWACLESPPPLRPAIWLFPGLSAQLSGYISHCVAPSGCGAKFRTVGSSYPQNPPRMAATLWAAASSANPATSDRENDFPAEGTRCRHLSGGCSTDPRSQDRGCLFLWRSALPLSCFLPSECLDAFLFGVLSLELSTMQWLEAKCLRVNLGPSSRNSPLPRCSLTAARKPSSP